VGQEGQKGKEGKEGPLPSVRIDLDRIYGEAGMAVLQVLGALVFRPCTGPVRVPPAAHFCEGLLPGPEAAGRAVQTGVRVDPR
jgi:hypothetical protein